MPPAMAIRRILTAEEPILRERTKRVSSFDASLHRLLDDMLETMRDAPGVGLAANQIGVPLQVAVIELHADPAFGTEVLDVAVHAVDLYVAGLGRGEGRQGDDEHRQDACQESLATPIQGHRVDSLDAASAVSDSAIITTHS